MPISIYLAAVIAVSILLPAGVIAHRASTRLPEPPHDPADCRHCAATAGADSAVIIPAQRSGDAS